ncbi:class I SAM-dependent methyltransferase [Candidatus Chlamydia corallus]|uniref:class I SAM-dependent methyltransferase n=1 Tax=Candidatus Chlamydia corallus TaxID=2038470 RepID=UPI000C2FCEDC|nr:class I SAM-dependent methyltransferase [Candidatus Chlamydia corallus]
MHSKFSSQRKKNTFHKQETSWNPIASSYNKLVQNSGHYYHRETILPQLLPLLALNSKTSLLDIGCGQGFLERMIPKKCRYLGIDISPRLINLAKKMQSERSHEFKIADLSKPLQSVELPLFSHAVAILSLQNMEFPGEVIRNTGALLEPLGQFFIVLNHPCFRIPRASSWHYNENKKIISRNVERYLSPMKIPIIAHPGQKDSPSTLSFHFPLSYWFKELSSNGFLVKNLEEWISSKTSTGKRAKAENLCRKEFPLFLMISCIKIK